MTTGPVLLKDIKDGVVTLPLTGVAVGAGLNLALGCDFAVATPESQFSQIFARRGLPVDFGGSCLMPKLARARSVTFGGADATAARGAFNTKADQVFTGKRGLK